MEKLTIVKTLPSREKQKKKSNYWFRFVNDCPNKLGLRIIIIIIKLERKRVTKLGPASGQKS